jgi:hypothetical protein
MTIAEKLPVRLRGRQAHLQTLEEFDRGWATLLAQIDELRRQETALGDQIVESYTRSATQGAAPTDVEELNVRLAKVRGELEPLLAARANEGQLRQRVVTQLAERRFDEIAADRRKLEHQARSALTELRTKADEFAKADAKLRALGDKDAELANEQSLTNTRGHLNRQLEATFQGIGLGNVDVFVQRIEEDLIAIARRQEGQ